jgi:recombination protein RecR
VSAIDDLVSEFSRLPTIGRKSAMRLTYHLLRQPGDQSRRLAAALVALIEKVKPCTECGNLTEVSPCALCADPRRDRSLICVVEEASDIPSIERTGEYRGLYHVLGGRLAPLDGIGPDDLSVGALVRRVTDGAVTEVIIATNPKLEGEATALYLQEQLREAGVTVSRLARGLPIGGDLEYADGVTIVQALAARRAM